MSYGPSQGAASAPIDTKEREIPRLLSELACAVGDLHGELDRLLKTLDAVTEATPVATTNKGEKPGASCAMGNQIRSVTENINGASDKVHYLLAHLQV